MREDWRIPNIVRSAIAKVYPVDMPLIEPIRKGTYLVEVDNAECRNGKLSGRLFIWLEAHIVTPGPNSEIVTFPYAGRTIHIYYAAWTNYYMRERSFDLGFDINHDTCDESCKYYIGRQYKIRSRIIKLKDQEFNQFDLIQWVK